MHQQSNCFAVIQRIIRTVQTKSYPTKDHRYVAAKQLLVIEQNFDRYPFTEQAYKAAIIEFSRVFLDGEKA